MPSFDRHKIYYTYALLDPRKPGKFVYDDLDNSKEWTFNFEPFYIGKGKNNRLNEHKKYVNYNKHKSRKIRNIEAAGFSIIRILIEDRLTEKQAFTLEKHFINTVGRAHLKTGPLTNLTEGGVGVADLEKAALRKRVASRQNKSSAELKKILEKQVASFKQTINSRTKEEKEKWSATMKQVHKSRPEPYKKQITAKRLSSLDRQKVSINTSSVWRTRTAEERQAITDKRLATREKRKLENPDLYKRK